MTPRTASVEGPVWEGAGVPSRVLGQTQGTEPGPTLICVAGLHGNEPAGIKALERIFGALSSERPPLRGEFVGLVGNLAALSQRRRYLDRDLNRGWLPLRVEALASGDGHGRAAAAEDREARALLRELFATIDRAAGQVYVFDIHTTSGESVPFGTIGDTLHNRAFAMRFPLPIVLGLEEQLDGTLLDYLTGLGHVTMAVEAGRHDSPIAVDHAEAAIWIALSAAGLISNRELPQVRSARAMLTEHTRDVPRVLEVRHRHPVFPGDDFRMEPGFVNFQPVQPNQLLARTRNGEIRSRWQARLLMPLYQEQGEDGFFIVRDFRPLWLKISAALRRLRLPAIAHWLPGVRRHPERAHTLVIDRRFVRFYAIELFHLLGFRKIRAVGNVILVSRRREG